jgi:hypothetical protein
MPAPLEHIVRPFQAGDVFTFRRLPRPDAVTIIPPDDKIIVWEGKADTKFVDEGEPFVNEAKSDLKEDKTQRESRLVKVVNPDDKDQKVFVERIDKTVFKDEKTGKQMSLAFDWSNPKDQGA